METNKVYKIASGCIANRIKKILPNIISKEQTGFIKGRYIGENTRLIYHGRDRWKSATDANVQEKCASVQDGG